MEVIPSTATYDHLFKVLLIGDSGVGKSSLLNRFCDNSFSSTQQSTVGVDFKVRYLRVHKSPTEILTLKCALWDSAGQERFRTLTSSYYRGSHAIILVYSAADRVSFESLDYWLEEIDRHSTNLDAVKLIIANKFDLPFEVSADEGREYAKKNSALFVQASAKTAVGVTNAFEELIFKILENPSLLDDSAEKNSTRLRHQTNPNSCCA